MYSRCLNGVVTSTLGGHLTVQAETGRKHKIEIEHTDLCIGDKVLLQYDYTKQKVIGVFQECELLDCLEEPPEWEELPEVTETDPEAELLAWRSFSETE